MPLANVKPVHSETSAKLVRAISERDNLRAINAELVAALQAVINMHKIQCADGPILYRDKKGAMDKARAAIKKATS